MTGGGIEQDATDEGELVARLAVLRTPPPDTAFEARLRAALVGEAETLRVARSAPKRAWRRAQGRWFSRVVAGAVVTLSASAAAAWWAHHVVQEAKRKEAIEAPAPVATTPSRAIGPRGARVVPAPTEAEPSPTPNDGALLGSDRPGPARAKVGTPRTAVVNRLALPERSLPKASGPNVSNLPDAQPNSASVSSERSRRESIEASPRYSKGKGSGRETGALRGVGQGAAKSDAAKERAAERRERAKETRGRSGR